MKKIFALGSVAIISIFAVTAALADVGEEEPVNVAPAIIRVPKEPVKQQPSPAPRPMAQTGKRTIRDTELRTECQQSVTGTVSCIEPSSLMQPKAKIFITDQGGNEIGFIVKTLAVIYDNNGNILSLDSLQQGARVQVNYRILCGDFNEATAIKVLR